MTFGVSCSVSLVRDDEKEKELEDEKHKAKDFNIHGRESDSVQWVVFCMVYCSHVTCMFRFLFINQHIQWIMENLHRKTGVILLHEFHVFLIRMGNSNYADNFAQVVVL